MSIVIKEIVVNTTVEPEKRQEGEWIIPPGMIEQIKEEVLKAMERCEYVELKRKER